MTICDHGAPPDFRRCVGIMLLDSAGRAWVGRRIDDADESDSIHRWQMPQGGIDAGEDPASAALRELEEEVGTANARILAESRHWLAYEFPAEVQARKRAEGRPDWKGQCQKWFAMLFRGDESEFRLDAHKPEFDAWRWVELNELPELIVPFKHAVYKQVVAEFRALAEDLARTTAAR